MSTAQPTLVEELGDALREVRWRLRVSQRELAEQLGVSKTWVARLESGEVSAAVAAVSRLVADLGLRLAVTVDDDVVAPRGSAPGAGSDTDRAAVHEDGSAAGGGAAARPDLADTDTARPDLAHADLAHADLAHADHAHPDPTGVDAPKPTTTAASTAASAVGGTAGTDDVRARRWRRLCADPEAVAQIERWRDRVERERVRDAAGRRLPAHLVAFPMSYPHHWWFLRHHGWSLRRRPIWSFVHGTPVPDSVRRIGDNPAPLGLHPDGGWPMQGRPGPEVRAEWPPTFPYRPRRYADPLLAA